MENLQTNRSHSAASFFPFRLRFQITQSDSEATWDFFWVKDYTTEPNSSGKIKRTKESIGKRWVEPVLELIEIDGFKEWRASPILRIERSFQQAWAFDTNLRRLNLIEAEDNKVKGLIGLDLRRAKGDRSMDSSIAKKRFEERQDFTEILLECIHNSIECLSCAEIILWAHRDHKKKRKVC